MFEMKISNALTAIAASTGIILAIQAIKAKQQLGAQLLETEPEELECDGLTIAFFGDSLAVGLGADKYSDTPGYIVAKRLDARYRNYAVSGAVSADLNSQIDTLDVVPDISVIIIGTNDITHGKSMRRGVKYLSDAVTRLKSIGGAVFVVPCIDLDIVSSLNNPLRMILGSISRHYALLQAWDATKAGAHVVDPRPIYKVFNRKVLFSVDRFHPSSLGYKVIAEHLILEIKRKIELT